MVRARRERRGGRKGEKGEKGGKDKGEKGEKGKGEKGKGEKGEKGKGEKGDKSASGEKKADDAKDSAKAQTPPASNRLAEALQKVGPWLKWLVFAALAVAVLVALLRGGLGWLANFTDWARRWLEAWRAFWEGLFSAKPEDESESTAFEEAAADPTVPFSAFADPFLTGKAARLDARELVRYTFQALEAWARERDLGRRPDETAQEFLARLGDELPTLDAEARRLGELHARVEYGRGTLPGGAVETVRRFWERLQRVTDGAAVGVEYLGRKSPARSSGVAVLCPRGFYLIVSIPETRANVQPR